MNLWKNRRRRLGFELKARARLGSLPESEIGDRPEERDEVWQAIRRLADQQRACIVLRYYEDLPESQIAHVLNCSVGTVKSHLSRALARLRKELTNEA